MAKYDAMVEYKKRESEKKKEKVVKTLEETIKNKEEIIIKALAERAGVSRSFIYNNPNLIQMVFEYRNQKKKYSANKKTRNQILSERIKNQEKKIKNLLDIKYKYDKLKEKCKKLERENESLLVNIYEQSS